MRRRPGRLAAATAAALGALVACAPATTPEPTSSSTVEVFTWWASGSEKLAFDVLVGRFGQAHPQIRLVDAGVAGGAGSTAKDVLASRLANDDPPDTFQVHGGAELVEHVADGSLVPLDALAAELDLAGTVHPEVLDAVSVDGTVYAVPVDVHRANLVWADPQVLAAAGLDPTAAYPTLDAWIEALRAVAATGRTPLALAATWTQVHLLEQVLLSRLGPAGYVGLWDGSTDPMSDEVLAAVEDFVTVLGLSNADRDALDWEDAAQRVAQHEAAFVVMGDWALPVLSGGSQQPVWAPFPGTSGTFDLVVDAFGMPVGAPSPQAATVWLRHLHDPSAQVAFTNAKGALPARADLGTAVLGTYHRQALADLGSDQVVASLTHGSAVPPDALDALTAAVGQVARGEATAADLQGALARAAAAG